MRSLAHAANAVRHAETLAAEAEHQALHAVADRLRTLASAVTDALDLAVTAERRVAPARGAREEAHAALSAAYQQATYQLERALGPADAAELTPGSTLDIAERTRFRLRRLAERAPSHDDDVEHRLGAVSAALEKELRTYENAVDAYLAAVARAHVRKDLAVERAQRLRRHLEEAKAYLLCHIPVGSESHRRVRALVVRTRRSTRQALTAVSPSPLKLFTTDEGRPLLVSAG